MAAHAYAIPNSVSLEPGATTKFMLNYQVVVGDGVHETLFGSTFAYDATQTTAVNLAAMKTDISQKAADFGFTLATSNILVFTAVN